MKDKVSIIKSGKLILFNALFYLLHLESGFSPIQIFKIKGTSISRKMKYKVSSL